MMHSLELNMWLYACCVHKSEYIWPLGYTVKHTGITENVDNVCGFLAQRALRQGWQHDFLGTSATSPQRSESGAQYDAIAGCLASAWWPKHHSCLTT